MPTSTGSDPELLAEHRAGATGAFDELFRRHRDRLWAVAVRTLGDRADAEDAVQETFVAALRSTAPGGSCGYRGEADVGTWLHRILVNKCVDRMRRSRSTPVADVGAGAAVGDPSAGVATRLAVDEALALLSPEQRAAVVLVDVAGQPVADVARALGVPAGTVKSRCARGRLRLAELLGHLREET